MAGEEDLTKLVKSIRPVLNNGSYVFCTVENLTSEFINHAVLIFKEKEGNTLIIKKELADSLGLEYQFIASWITLSVHSSLEAAGLTAVFSKALADMQIGCNVVAAYYHDHIFVKKKDADQAMSILIELSNR
jgi:hypothetical protein